MNQWPQELGFPLTIRLSYSVCHSFIACLLPEAGYSLFPSIHFLLLPLSNTSDSHSHMADHMATQRLYFPASLAAEYGHVTKFWLMGCGPK